MRIGFDAKRAFSNNTGLGNYSRYTINALCRIYPENKYSLYTPETTGKSIFHPPENARIFIPDSIWSKNLKSYWRTFGIGKQLVKDNIDLYHGLSNEIPLGIEKTKVRSVVTIHDLIFLALPKLYKAIDRKIYLNKVRNAVSNADRIIAISKQTNDDLVSLLGADQEKIKIVYQGCNPWFYKKENNDQLSKIRKKYTLPENYLLYVGTIEERKNLLTIVQALHHGKIDIPLVAIGKKSRYFEKVKGYIAEKKVKNIHFYHYIENNDLPAIYQQAEAFIYPSSYEGFGIPVLEALNSGIPVVTSRGGCLEETVGKGGLLTSPGDAEELSEAIKNVLYDSKLRADLIQAGAKHALQFREEKTIPQLLEVYKECIR